MYFIDKQYPYYVQYYVQHVQQYYEQQVYN